MALHIGEEFLLGKEFSLLVLIHPLADLAVPYEAVSAELDAVLAAEVGNLVGVFPVVLSLCRLGRSRFHCVLGCDAVEFPLDEGNLGRICHVAVVHCNTYGEIILVGVLESVRNRSLDSSARLSRRDCAEC